MENKKAELSEYLKNKIQAVLKDKYDVDAKTISQNELELIDSLVLDRPNNADLKGISKLPNLKNLQVITEGKTAFEQTENYHSISDSDGNEISKCVNLENLSIINQAKLVKLDISNLNKLKSLTIKNNMNLKEVNGFSELNGLEELNFYGNDNLQGVKNLDKVVLDNPDLYKLNLDFSLFPDAVGYSYENDTYNQKALNRLQRIQDTCEASYIESMCKKEVKIKHSDMFQIHKKACEILQENNIDGNVLDTVRGIEQYIAENVKCKNIEQATDKSIITGPRNGASGAYTAIMNGMCSIEGYARMEKYLLGLKNISSRIVNCIPKEENSASDKYCSIICIEMGKGEYSFSDPRRKCT